MDKPEINDPGRRGWELDRAVQSQEEMAPKARRKSRLEELFDRATETLANRLGDVIREALTAPKPEPVLNSPGAISEASELRVASDPELNAEVDRLTAADVAFGSGAILDMDEEPVDGPRFSDLDSPSLELGSLDIEADAMVAADIPPPSLPQIDIDPPEAPVATGSPAIQTARQSSSIAREMEVSNPELEAVSAQPVPAFEPSNPELASPRVEPASSGTFEAAPPPGLPPPELEQGVAAASGVDVPDLADVPTPEQPALEVAAAISPDTAVGLPVTDSPAPSQSTGSSVPPAKMRPAWVDVATLPDQPFIPRRGMPIHHQPKPPSGFGDHDFGTEEVPSDFDADSPPLPRIGIGNESPQTSTAFADATRSHEHFHDELLDYLSALQEKYLTLADTVRRLANDLDRSGDDR
jgi:hypothetical protein